MSEKGTEQATPQRKKKARERGDGVRSRELLSSAAMLGGIITLGVVAGHFSKDWSAAYVESLQSVVPREIDGEQFWIWFVYRVLRPMQLSVSLVMVTSMVCSTLW